MDIQDQQMAAQRHMLRATELANALHANRGLLNPGASYSRLREAYATGKITLEHFEKRVADLLRSER